MAAIPWDRGDGQTLYQPATAGIRMWISQDVMNYLRPVWSRDGHEYSPVDEALTGHATVQLEPKLYRFKWRAQLVARREEKRRAKNVVTDVPGELRP